MSKYTIHKTIAVPDRSDIVFKSVTYCLGVYCGTSFRVVKESSKIDDLLDERSILQEMFPDRAYSVYCVSVAMAKF